MNNQIHWKYVYPIGLLLVMLADGQISNGLRTLSHNSLFLSSHLFLLGLIMGSLYFSKTYMVTLSIVLGWIFDNYYYSILGINMVSLPLTVLLIYLVFEYVEPSILSLILSLVIFITIMDSSLFLVQIVFKLIYSDALVFITKQLGPTLLMNLAVVILFSYPLRHLIKDR
ncbi:rod shape-determining protein MreD [Vagococcus humatus]|nr:rod shape-determining protein MreD [Vagococcus humatus]